MWGCIAPEDYKVHTFEFGGAAVFIVGELVDLADQGGFFLVDEVGAVVRGIAQA